MNVPESGDYDAIKAAVLEIIPMLPELVRSLFHRRMVEMGAKDIRWREPKPTTVDKNGKQQPITLVGGEGVWEASVGESFNAFHKTMFLSGSEVKGCWLAGLSPGYMGGSKWVFNFTLAISTI